MNSPGFFRQHVYLNVNWFMSPGHALEGIGLWQEDYNSIQPHRSLGWLTAEELLVQ